MGIQPVLSILFLSLISPNDGQVDPTGSSSELDASPAIPTSAPSAIPPVFPLCSVCGEGLRVTLPNVVLRFGDTLETCGRIQAGGAIGLIAPGICSTLPDTLFDLCGCLPTINPLPSDTAAPTRSPTTPTPTALPVTAAPVTVHPTTTPTDDNSAVFPVCVVCGEGFEVNLPDVFLRIGNSITTCGSLQLDGLAGLIEPDDCTDFSNQIFAVCGCAPAPPTPAPIISAAPVTVAPTTSAPIAVAPTTLVPTNKFPPPTITTVPNTTTAPITTAAPIVVEPNTTAPIVVIPNTSAPTTMPVAPNTSAPIVLAPVTAAPITSAPITSVPTSSPTEAPPVFPVCAVCGQGFGVSLPNVFLRIGNSTTTCGSLELGGLAGLIEPEECDGFSNLIFAVCGCIPLTLPPTAPTATLTPTTPAPTAMAPAASAPVTVIPTSAPIGPGTFPACNICGEGAMTMPETLLLFSRNDATTSCAEFSAAGLNGEIDPALCANMPSEIFGACGCLSARRLRFTIQS